jgi:hypothetical protein
MNSIIEAMYGGGGKPVSSDTQPGKPASGSGYYGSFQHFSDINKGVGPPPANQGGPTALEISQQEGYDESKSIINAMYGGAPSEIQSTTKSMNPNWNAANSYSTVGGIGNTDAYGNKIYWSPPLGAQLTEGEPFKTPAGTYTVGKNPWGQFVLIPEGDAVKGAGPYLTNMHAGEHHVGINPQTGEVWYQKAAGYTNFSGGGDSYTQTDGSPVAPNNPGNDPDNGPPKKGWVETLNDGTLEGLFPNGASLQKSAEMKQGKNNVRGSLFSSLKDADYYKRILENLAGV